MKRKREDKVLVMGVAGCGKSTLGTRLATALGATFIEGDAYHSPSSKRKMRVGVALDDADRGPWLDRLAALLSALDGSAVLACSALKRRYRDRLRAAVPSLQVVYIDITPAKADERIRLRADPSFHPALMASQFETLESPADEAGVMVLRADQPVATQVRSVVSWLGRAPA